MNELSTAPLLAVHTPRRSSAGSWTLLSITGFLGVLLVAAAPTMGGARYGWASVAVVAAFALRLASIDEHTHTLPNRFTGALAIFGVIQAAGISSWRHEAAPLVVAAVTAGILTAVYGVLAFTGATGFGDIKFAGALALSIAPYAGFLTLYLLPIAFIISALRIMGRHLRGRPAKHPHGTSLAIAGLTLMAGAMIAGPALALT